MCVQKAKEETFSDKGIPSGFVSKCGCAHAGVLFQDVYHGREFSFFFRGHSPVSVSVVAMCEWRQVSLFPEGPGPCRCPASSSYTVYTKLCMYKIEKSAKETGHMEGEVICPHTQFIYHVVTTAPEYCPYCSRGEGNAWLISGICVAGAANRLLHNREHWLASWSLQDTELARWQSSFAENLGQGGRSTQCPLTNSTDHGVRSSTNTEQPHPISPRPARYVAARKNTHAHQVLGY